MWYGPEGQLRRPQARELADLTAILRALGRTSEAEIDRGRWSHEVPAQRGPVTVTLAIPELLTPIDAPPSRRGGPPDRRAMERLTAEVQRFTQDLQFESLEEANAALRERFSGPLDDLPSTATTPLDQAQEVMYQAFEARGRRRILLARRALELSADCADAYVMLAEESRTPGGALAFYEQGVAAGERALGPELFAQEAGHFWGSSARGPTCARGSAWPATAVRWPSSAGRATAARRARPCARRCGATGTCRSTSPATPTGRAPCPTPTPRGAARRPSSATWSWARRGTRARRRSAGCARRRRPGGRASGGGDRAVESSPLSKSAWSACPIVDGVAFNALSDKIHN
jgi:hypothetical protein